MSLAAASGGCASVIEGTTQPVAVATAPEIGASCTCSNDNGKWTLVTPGTVTVKKSRTVLTIRCSKPGWVDATTYAVGKISKAGVAGEMVPYVGLLSYGADMSTGAMLTYPDSVIVPMQKAEELPQPPPLTEPSTEPSIVIPPPPPKHHSGG